MVLKEHQVCVFLGDHIFEELCHQIYVSAGISYEITLPSYIYIYIYIYSINRTVFTVYYYIAIEDISCTN